MDFMDMFVKFPVRTVPLSDFIPKRTSEDEESPPKSKVKLESCPFDCCKKMLAKELANMEKSEEFQRLCQKWQQHLENGTEDWAFIREKDPSPTLAQSEPENLEIKHENEVAENAELEPKEASPVPDTQSRPIRPSSSQIHSFVAEMPKIHIQIPSNVEKCVNSSNNKMSSNILRRRICESASTVTAAKAQDLSVHKSSEFHHHRETGHQEYSAKESASPSAGPTMSKKVICAAVNPANLLYKEIDDEIEAQRRHKTEKQRLAFGMLDGPLKIEKRRNNFIPDDANSAEFADLIVNIAQPSSDSKEANMPNTIASPQSAEKAVADRRNMSSVAPIFASPAIQKKMTEEQTQQHVEPVSHLGHGGVHKYANVEQHGSGFLCKGCFSSLRTEEDVDDHRKCRRPAVVGNIFHCYLCRFDFTHEGYMAHLKNHNLPGHGQGLMKDTLPIPESRSCASVSVAMNNNGHAHYYNNNKPNVGATVESSSDHGSQRGRPGMTLQQQTFGPLCGHDIWNGEAWTMAAWDNPFPCYYCRKFYKDMGPLVQQLLGSCNTTQSYNSCTQKM